MLKTIIQLCGQICTLAGTLYVESLLLAGATSILAPWLIASLALTILAASALSMGLQVLLNPKWSSYNYAEPSFLSAFSIFLGASILFLWHPLSTATTLGIALPILAIIFVFMLLCISAENNELAPMHTKEGERPYDIDAGLEANAELGKMLNPSASFQVEPPRASTDATGEDVNAANPDLSAAAAQMQA